MKPALAVLVLSLAACRQSPPPPKTAAGFALEPYSERGGSYSCLVPSEWRVKEGSGASRDVMLFGPNGATLSIAAYPEGDPHVKTPQDYASAEKLGGGKASPLAETSLNGRAAYRMSVLDRPSRPGARPYSRRTDAILIPYPGGFWALEHRAPEASHAATLPVLEAAAQSFQPGR